MAGNKVAFNEAMKKASDAEWDRQWDLAIQEYRRALTEFPDDMSVHEALARTLQECGRFEEALREYGAIRPAETQTLEHIAELYERLDRREQATLAWLELAELFSSEKDMNRAVEAWQRAASLSLDHEEAHLRLLAAYRETGQKSAAAQELAALSRIYRAQGDNAHAESALVEASELDPVIFNVDAVRAEWRGIASQPVPVPTVRAIDDVRVQIETGPVSDRAVQALSISVRHMKEGKTVAAEDEALGAIEIAPDLLPAHAQLAEIFVNAKRLPEAREKYQLVAETAVVRGDNKAAAAFYRRSYELEPDTARRAELLDIFISLGVVDEVVKEYTAQGAELEQAGQLREAIDNYRKAIQFAQETGETSDRTKELRAKVAEAYIKLQDWENALPLFEQAHEGAPEDERIHFILIELLLRLGQRERGERELDALLAQNANLPKKSRALLKAFARDLPNDTAINSRFAPASSAAGK